MGLVIILTLMAAFMAMGIAIYAYPIFFQDHIDIRSKQLHLQLCKNLQKTLPVNLIDDLTRNIINGISIAFITIGFLPLIKLYLLFKILAVIVLIFIGVFHIPFTFRELTPKDMKVEIAIVAVTFALIVLTFLLGDCKAKNDEESFIEGDNKKFEKQPKIKKKKN